MHPHRTSASTFTQLTRLHCYVRAETFVLRHFDPKDAPDLRTVRDWVRTGKLPGRDFGRRTYVDEEAFLNSTGNALADKILADKALARKTYYRI